MLQPPGRRVYQRGSYTIWEVDGATAPVSVMALMTSFCWLLIYSQLYCQNISLFGKLFIDHKVKRSLFIVMQISTNSMLVCVLPRRKLHILHNMRCRNKSA